MRITAQLIQVADQTHLWVESHECEVRDLLSIQTEFASRVRRSLQATLLLPGPTERSEPPISSSAGYDCYLRGRYCWSRRHEGGLQKAIEWFQSAVEQDPRLSLAYSGLADSYALLSWYGQIPPRETGPKALAAARKAVELNNGGEGHASLALTRFWYEWDWAGAETSFRRALDLSLNHAIAHQWFASYLIAMGRFQEASTELQRALELDPLYLIIVQSMGDPLFYARKYDEAIGHYLKALDLNPEFAPAHFSLGRAYEQKGLYQEALREFEKANTFSGTMEAAPAMAHALALLGATAEATQILNQLVIPGNGMFRHLRRP